MVFAQNADHVKKERMKNIVVAPSLGVEFFKFSNYETSKKDYTIIYEGVPSMKYGFDVVYKHSDKVEVNTGLYYTAKKFNRTEACNTCDNEYFYKSKFRSKYLETLIGATYNFVSGRFDAGVYTNLNFGMLISSTETRTTESGNEFLFNNKPFSNKFLTIGEPGLSFNYNLTYRLSLGLRTGYRFYFNSFDVKKTYRNNSITVQPGLFYKF